ncbi:Nitrogen regulatory protein P-II [Lactococcus lactis]|nr:Nitrogen regulatory protein P-II [Lactococcus lactis]
MIGEYDEKAEKAKNTLTYLEKPELEIRNEDNNMKKMEITIRPESLEKLKDILAKNGVHGMTVYSAMGAGNQNSDISKIVELSGGQFHVNLLPKIVVITYIEDERSEKLISEIVDELSTGNVGDGKIAVVPLETIVRIRTGESGSKAL